MQEILQQLVAVDHQVFRWINQVAVSPGLDQFFRVVTDLHKNIIFQAGVFPVLMAVGIYKYRVKFLKWMLALALLIGFTDAFNYRILKKYGGRDRPVFVSDLKVELRTEKSPSDPSFPSNHAINTVAGATLLAAVLPQLRWVFFIITVLVVYSRPYLGVHFPLDVLVGSALGFCFARIFIVQLFRRFKWWEFPSKNTSEV